MPARRKGAEVREESPEEDLVSLSQVKELLEQQKEMFKALLLQQQETFQGFVKVIMDSTNSRLDAVHKEVQEIKTSLQFTQQEVDDIKSQNVAQSVRCSSVQADNKKICDSLSAVTDKVEYTEGQSRRNNLVFDGIAETPAETWAETEDKVRDVLVEKLKLQPDVEVERAHRIGRTVPGGSRPRSIVVKFLRFKDRSAVLERAKNLKGTDIYVNEDYTDAVRMKRKELLPKMREARERGEYAYLRHDRLIIRPRNSNPKSPGGRERGAVSPTQREREAERTGILFYSFNCHG